MKKYISILLLFTSLISCGVKQTRKAIAAGDYDYAIDKCIKKLDANKNAKGKQKYVFLLEEAFAKAKDRDLRQIDLASKDPNPSTFEKIYNTYKQLNNRQEKIRPLLPLKLMSLNKNATFDFEDYSDKLISSKNAFSNFLYENAKVLLKSNNKLNFRKAYDDLVYLEQLQSNYKDARKYMDEAKAKGIDYVHLSTKNETNMIIPKRLETDLLDFSTFGLNDQWTVYHNNRLKTVVYDYELSIMFREINISPEQIKEKEFFKEKEIVDGKKPLLNDKGQPSRDRNGKVIMTDNLKTVKIYINEVRQIKTCQVVAKIDYIDLRSNGLINTFPINSQFVFEHIYSSYNGDKRASDNSYLNYFNNKVVPFPSNEQMVYDAGQDLKTKIKDIIIKNKFRR